MSYADDVVIEGFKDSNEAGPARVYIRDALLEHKPHHSPDGFQWGYGGSGPADLALAILCACIDEPPAKVKIWRGQVGAKAFGLHQQFKREHVCRWGEVWQITVGEVRAWVRAHDGTEELIA